MTSTAIMVQYGSSSTSVSLNSTCPNSDSVTVCMIAAGIRGCSRRSMSRRSPGSGRVRSGPRTAWAGSRNALISETPTMPRHSRNTPVTGKSRRNPNTKYPSPMNGRTAMDTAVSARPCAPSGVESAVRFIAPGHAVLKPTPCSAAASSSTQPACATSSRAMAIRLSRAPAIMTGRRP